MALKIITYAATDPATPTNMRAMARAVLDGKIQVATAMGATPDEAGAALKAFFDKKLDANGETKPRGRPKKTIEAALGTPEHEFGEIV